MTPAPQGRKPLVLITGPPASRGFGINTHIRMLLATGLSETYRLEQVDLGGETWRATVFVRVWRLLAQLLRFREQVRRKRPAIVHINSAPDAKAFLRDAAALWLIPGGRTATVFEFHGGFEQNTVLQGPRPVRRFAERTLRRASAVVTLNQYHADLLLELCPGLKGVRVIPNFLEPELMTALVEGRPVATGGALRLLFVSRVTREKGVLDAIEAVRILHGKGIGVHLTVAGTGEDLREAEALAVRHGVGSAVEFMGFAEGDDRIRAYLSSDVFVFPTRWNEGFPYVLLEAMAAGLPIVSTTHGVMPHLIKDGVNGYLTEPGDAGALAESIGRLAGHPELRAEMGRNNRREVKASYGIEEATRAYGRLYREVLRRDP